MGEVIMDRIAQDAQAYLGAVPRIAFDEGELDGAGAIGRGNPVGGPEEDETEGEPGDPGWEPKAGHAGKYTI
jgi:hypothetical protein